MRITRITRENAVKHMLNSGGRMFSVVWESKNGMERKINGKFIMPPSKRHNQDKIFGYVTVYNPHKAKYRRVNTRTIKELAINKKKYKIK